MKSKVFGLIGGFTSLVQVFAISTPWWIIILKDDRRYVYGLWYTLSCEVSQGVSFCKNTYHYDDTSVVSGTFLEYQIETMIAAVLCLVAAVVSAIYKHRGEKKENIAFGLSGFFIFITSGILVWLTVGNLCRENINKSRYETIDVPWSLILSGLTGLVTFALAAILVPRLISNIREIRLEKIAERALNKQIQSSTANLYTTNISMERLPPYEVNAGNNITPSSSQFSVLESTSSSFPGDSLQRQDKIQIFL